MVHLARGRAPARALALAAVCALGLAGFVRNLRDGRVEAEVCGPADKVEALIAACRRGPPGSRVDGLEIATASAAALPELFEIRRDG